MSGLTEPTPNFPLAEGFTLPPLDAEEMTLANEVFSLERYTSAPLVSAAAREQIFGTRTPQGEVGNFVCNGFVIHTLESTEEGTATGAIIAPMPGLTEIEFLDFCLQQNEHAMPEPPFHRPKFDVIAAALARTGISAATGLHIGQMQKPPISMSALTIPRVYINELGGAQNQDEPSVYAIKLSSVLFRRLTLLRLQDLRSGQKSDGTPD